MNIRSRDGDSSLLIPAIIAVVVILAIVGVVYFQSRRPAPPTPPSPPPSPPPVTTVVNPEKLAEADLMRLKTTIDAAIEKQQFAEAWRLCGQFDTDTHAGTTSVRAMTETKQRVRDLATQAWASIATNANALRDKQRFPDALALCEQATTQFQGIGIVVSQIDATRTGITAARDALAAKRAASQTAAQTKTQSLQTSSRQWIVHGQWDQYQAAVRQALTEAGNDVILQEALEPFRSEADSLVALRRAVDRRVRSTPSTSLRLPVRTGIMEGALVNLDADQLLLRKPLGEFGTTDTKVPWKDLTPDGLTTLFGATYDRTSPEEVFAYAGLLTYLALEGSIPAENALKTVKTLRVVAPAREAFASRYEGWLTALVQSNQTAGLASNPISSPTLDPPARRPTPVTPSPPAHPEVDLSAYKPNFDPPPSDFRFQGRLEVVDVKKNLLVMRNLSTNEVANAGSTIAWFTLVGLCQISTFDKPYGRFPRATIQDLKPGMTLNCECRVGMGKQILTTSVTEFKLLPPP